MLTGACCAVTGRGIKDRRFGGSSTGERLIHAILCMRYVAQRGPRLFEGERNTLSSAMFRSWRLDRRCMPPIFFPRLRTSLVLSVRHPIATPENCSHAEPVCFPTLRGLRRFLAIGRPSNGCLASGSFRFLSGSKLRLARFVCPDSRGGSPRIERCLRCSGITSRSARCSVECRQGWRLSGRRSRYVPRKAGSARQH